MNIFSKFYNWIVDDGRNDTEKVGCVENGAGNIIVSFNPIREYNEFFRRLEGKPTFSQIEEITKKIDKYSINPINSATATNLSIINLNLGNYNNDDH
ncbi:MAG: hypothetical protein ACYCSW_05335 [bacterium]